MATTWKILIDSEQLAALRYVVEHGAPNHGDLADFIEDLEMPAPKQIGELWVQPGLEIEVDAHMLECMMDAVFDYEDFHVSNLYEFDEEHALEYWPEMIRDLIHEDYHEPDAVHGFCL